MSSSRTKGLIHIHISAIGLLERAHRGTSPEYTDPHTEMCKCLPAGLYNVHAGHKGPAE